MKLWEVLRGARPFADEHEIRESVRKCEYYDPEAERIETSSQLLIFSTSSQKSWLVCTSQRLYFVLDDLSSSGPEIKWRRVKDYLIKDSRVIIDLKLEERSEKTGRVSIGRMNKGFLYTKSLFTEPGIKGSIYSLIKNQLIASKNA
jgi:hypothetical protein